MHRAVAQLPLVCEFTAYISKAFESTELRQVTRCNASDGCMCCKPCLSYSEEKHHHTRFSSVKWGDWTRAKRFFPGLCSSYWRMQEIGSACKSSRKICLVQFWIYANTWLQVSWGSPHKRVQGLGSEEFAQNGQPSVLLIAASWDQTPYLLWTFLLPHLRKWLMDKSLRSHRKTLLHMICSNLALLLMIASSLLLKFCSLGQASSMRLY